MSSEGREQHTGWLMAACLDIVAATRYSRGLHQFSKTNSLSSLRDVPRYTLKSNSPSQSQKVADA